MLIAALLGLAPLAGGCGVGSFDEASSSESAGESQDAVVSLPAPVAHWKYDDPCASLTVTDSSGNGANGTKLNNVGCTTDGRIESAGSFDGVDDRVEVADRPAFHFTTAMTAAAWVKPSRVTGLQTIVNKWYAPDSYMLLIQDGQYRFSVALANGPSLSIAAPAKANTWTHVAGVFNGSSIALYIDGVLATSMAASGTLQDSIRPVEMGNHPTWNAYAGLLDEVRLYNVALSPSQVQLLGQEVWPNGVSAANSDPWLPQHHDQIRALRPTVLALNFDNTKPMAQMTSSLTTLASALKEGSRYHAYSSPSAPAMLQYSFINVDLRDATDPPYAGYAYKNSTKYPRESPVQEAWGLDYAALFGPQFAQYYNIPDPVDGHPMNLCELVNAGVVNEVWIYGNGDVPDVSAAEVLEMKPNYDANRVRVAGPLNRCAGNGCFDQEDMNALPASCTRAVKVGWVNSGRGPGCFMESIGHNIESFGNGNLIPYFSTYWKDFAGFNLNTKYGTPFPSWYSCPYGTTGCLKYTPCAHDEHEVGAALPGSCSACASTVVSQDPYCGQTLWDNLCVKESTACSASTYVAYSTPAGSGTINNYDPVCQNAHFAPNSRDQYDDTSPAVVSSSCEHFRMFDGPRGATDLKVPFSTAKFSQYQALAPDCSGDWKVFWYQSFPGYNNSAKDSNGVAMLPWWPFLYY